MRAGFFFILSLVFVSCGKEVAFTEMDNALTGNWINPTYHEESILILDKSNELKKNEYGYTFKRDGRFIARIYAGFCGTPPITTNDYKGTWTRVDSTLFIQVDYRAGQAMYRWRILSLSNSQLKVRVEFANYGF